MYDLHNLGWNSFQQLCLTITREILGQTVESFLDAGDGGRDGAFTGTWKATGPEHLKGPFVIQCKYTSKINYVLRTFDLSDEVEKAICASSSRNGNSFSKRCFRASTAPARRHSR
jgi:hypothetical protein